MINPFAIRPKPRKRPYWWRWFLLYRKYDGKISKATNDEILNATPRDEIDATYAQEIAKLKWLSIKEND